jgi:hypothetical protein
MPASHYFVIPFQRVGVTIGPRPALVFDAPVPARMAAQQIAPQVAGIAILERQQDPETGDDKDTVIAEIGAVPPGFPAKVDWTLRLN